MPLVHERQDVEGSVVVLHVAGALGVHCTQVPAVVWPAVVSQTPEQVVCTQLPLAHCWLVCASRHCVVVPVHAAQ